MARNSVRKQRLDLDRTWNRPARAGLKVVEPVTSPAESPLLNENPKDPTGEGSLPILFGEMSLWSMGMTAFLLAPMAAAAVAVAPVMLASKLLPTRLLT